MRIRRSTGTGILGAVILLLVTSTQPAAAQDWEYRASIYAWLSGLDGTIAATPVGGGIPVSANFSDLADFLDFAAAGHFEAQNPKLVFLGDVNYVGLGADRDADVDGETVSVKLDYDQWIFELGGGYRVLPEFDLLLAGRLYSQNLGQTQFAGDGSTASKTTHTWADAFLGARWTKLLGERWWLSVRGDIGAGGSNLAWFGNAGFGYRFSDLVSLGLAYRILSMDYETGSVVGGDYYKYDVALNGLGLTLLFTF
jgi:hypothetical protein